MINKFFILISLIIPGLLFAEEFELRSESAYKMEHNNRYSVILGINPSLTKSNQVINSHFTYAKNTEENRWWELNFTYLKAYANKIATNNQNATGMNAVAFGDTDYSSQMALGLGVSYESKFIQNLIPVQNLYEIISTSVTYDLFKNTSAGKTFYGPGMIARFSTMKRFNDYIALGANFIYNLAVVKRSEEQSSETSSQRSLTLSHFTIGFDFSFYL